MNLSEKFLTERYGPKEEHILKSRVNDLYALMSNWDKNPPHINVYRDKTFIAKVPIFDEDPSLDKISSLNGDISDSDKKSIYDFISNKCHTGLVTLDSALSLWDILH